MKIAGISTQSVALYGALAAPVAFAGFPLYVLAPDFYAKNYGLSLASAGIALLALRLFDAFQDPIIGILSDLYRRHIVPIMICAAIILCVGMYGLFNHLYGPPLIWFAVCVGVSVTAYSVLTINLTSIGALWASTPQNQTRIAAMREGFALLGLIVSVSLPGVLTMLVPSGTVYQWFSGILALLMGAGLGLFIKWHYDAAPFLPPAPATQPPPPAPLCAGVNTKGIFALFTTLSKGPKKLLWVYFISMVASSIPAVLVVFFVRDLLNAQTYIGLFLGLYFLSAVAFMPVWKYISTIYGKYRSWMMSMFIAVISFIWAFTLGEGNIIAYGVICVASGAALGADLLFPPSILADQMQANDTQHAVATHYAVLTLVAKGALAFASATSLPLLQSVGFVPDANNTNTALTGLAATYALIPCALKIIAAACLWRLFIHHHKGHFHEQKYTPSPSHPSDNSRSNDNV